MKLDLKRGPQDGLSTISDLYVDGVWECYVLEDPVRKIKIPTKTAIPAGEYQVIITWSPRFLRDLPLLVNVPGFDGIRIHPGNTVDDTYGCLLPGRTRSVDFVGESRLAFEALYVKIGAALDLGQRVTISIDGAVAGPDTVRV